MAKKTVQKNKNTKKKTVQKDNPDTYKSSYPVWMFSLADTEHSKWSILSEKVTFKDIIPALKSFEGMTWFEIERQSGGKSRGTNHHFIPFKNMTKEAQKRAAELKILQHEHLFSLRLQSRVRLYGIRTNGIFHIVWYDTEHEICPSVKKHT